MTFEVTLSSPSGSPLLNEILAGHLLRRGLHVYYNNVAGKLTHVCLTYSEKIRL